MEKFFRIEKIGEGSYGTVYSGINRKTGKKVAIKKFHLEFSSDVQGLSPTVIREISILKELNHPNIVGLQEILSEDDKLYLVFEFLFLDLKKYMDSMPSEVLLDLKIVQSYLYQITNAIFYCHRRRVLHRDLKPQNLLIDTKGIIKVADFGLSRSYDIRIREYTHEIVTLWYRSPELLLGTKVYTCAVDIWSIGCIFAEMITRQPLFRGDSEIDQMFRIFRTLRTPNEDIWPGVTKLRDYKDTFPYWNEKQLAKQVIRLSSEGLDLLEKTMTYDPNSRISAKHMLEHKYFEDFDMKPIQIQLYGLK